MISFANPTNSGVANSSSMIVPCIVKSSLYCWSETMWRSGPSSWVRMIRAISPPTRKNPNEVIRYRWPITLWSVDESQSARMDPLRRGGVGLRGRAGGNAEVGRRGPRQAGPPHLAGLGDGLACPRGELRVDELPGPLHADHMDLDIGLGRVGADEVLVPGGEEE